LLRHDGDPPSQITSIRRPLSAPKKAAGDARLGPNTEIRARLIDGSVTPWPPAGAMAVATEGLESGRSYPLAAATDATISRSAEGAGEMLAATAPPGGEVTPTDAGELRLHGARLALHIDGDGDRTAFVFGGELIGGTAPGGSSLMQGSLVFGPRFGITEKTFASLLFQPSFLSPGNGPVTGQAMFSAEFGFDLLLPRSFPTH